MRIYDKYPLTTKRTTIRRSVDHVVSEQVVKKNVISGNTKIALQKKDLKDMGILLRLQALNSKGVLAVTVHLSSELREVKVEERITAKQDQVIAAAQRSIIRPNTEERTVRSLIQWMYGQNALVYDDPEHLYVLLVVAGFVVVPSSYAHTLSMILTVYLQVCAPRACKESWYGTAGEPVFGQAS